MKRDAISPKEERFCELIVGGETPANAVAKAGYTNKTPSVYAWKLMHRPRIISRLSLLRKAALEGVTQPGAVDVVLSRRYLIQRLVDIQHGFRDATALAAIKLLGQEEFQMFADLVAVTDPAKQSTDDLTRAREKLSRQRGVV